MQEKPGYKPSVKVCIMCQNRSSVTNTQTEDALQRITYHKLPSNPVKRDKWLEFCGLTRDSFPSFAFKFLCSNHFAPECFERDMRAELLYGTRRNILKKDVLPTIRTTEQQLKRKIDTELDGEGEREKRKKEVEQLLNGEIPVTETIVNPFRKHICDETSGGDAISRASSAMVHSNDIIQVLPRMGEAEMVHKIVELERVTADQRSQISKLMSTIDEKTEKINFAKTEMVNVAICLQELKEKENQFLQTRVREILTGRFGEGQLATILALKQIPWSTDELAQAFELRCISAEAFEYVVHQMRLPLPDASHIERWIHSVYLETGRNVAVLKLLKQRATTLSAIDRICTLNLMRTSMPVRYHYDRHRDQIIGPKSQLHCIAVQGIFTQWQQIVHIDFDLICTKSVIEKIVSDLHEIDYCVVAITTGCDREASDIWHALEVDQEHHYIQHPDTDDLIYVFACPDRTLAAIHRVLITDGFVWQENNVTITKAALMPLLQSHNDRSNNAEKFDQRYLDSEILKEIAYDATASRELISPQTSKVLKMLSHDEDEDDLLSTISTLFELFADWYDLCMTVTPLPECVYSQQPPITLLPFGANEEEQNIVLDGMFDVMETLRCVNLDNDYLSEAVLISIASMRKLLIQLKEKYPEITYIPMQRLSSVPLSETIVKLQEAVKKRAPSRTVSINEVLFDLCKTIAASQDDTHVTNALLRLGQFTCDTVPESLRRPDDEPDPDVGTVAERDACEYLTLLIAARLGDKYDYLGDQSIVIERKNNKYTIKPDGVEVLANVDPSALWTEQAKKLESYMRSLVYHRKVGLVDSLIDSIHKKHPRMGRDLIEMYVKKRVTIRLQSLNAKLEFLRSEKSN
ncbi:uncharacterized protein LOC128727159 [Anopheles nili]|uniref:uncharacterized protein LOC128727159 n=1 Tax=Anopheles nili TaxID=185578 RepID=UPI00237C51A4|nr:uncharacterized protein LOC128727159 [Anopheles nili]